MGSTDPKGEGDSAPKMPTARDVARIPTAVREHAVRMHQLHLADREHRKIWIAMREAHKAGKPPGDVLWATLLMWDNERALGMAAEVYRDHLAENDRQPVGSRWSPSVLATWVALTQAAPKPQ